MKATAKEELLGLLRDQSYAEREVVLASGRRSNFFIDCKNTALRAHGHVLVGAAMLEAARSLSPAAVAGVVLGGCSLASSVSYASCSDGGAPLDAVYVRKQTKEHGSARQIEGAAHLPEASAVVVVEDVVTTGGSTLRAVQTLNEAGFAVCGVVALVDREEGGRENLEAAGLRFRALFTRSDFA